MDLSIIILNYKTKGLLKNCLNNLLSLDSKIDQEIIVVDNNSSDGTDELMKEKFPLIRYIPLKRNIGHAAGNNAGIKAAKGKYILLLNTDIVFFDNSIEKMFDFMEKNNDVAVLGAKLKNPDQTVQYSCLKFPSLLVPIYSRTFLGNSPAGKLALADYRMQDFNHNQNREVDWVLSSCMFIRKEALDKIGLMDERFFVYFADVDLCRRFKQNYYKIIYFCNTNIIHYYHRESAENQGINMIFNPITRIHIKDWIKYLIKHKISAESLAPPKGCAKASGKKYGF